MSVRPTMLVNISHLQISYSNNANSQLTKCDLLTHLCIRSFMEVTSLVSAKSKSRNIKRSGFILI